MPGIDIKVSYVGDDREVAIIDISGYIDTTTAPEVDRVLEEQLALNKYRIIVNLEQVPYISSVGWGCFVGELNTVRNKNGDLVLANMGFEIYNIFELMEFSTIINSFTGIDSAVSYFLGTEAVKTRAEQLREHLVTRRAEAQEGHTGDRGHEPEAAPRAADGVQGRPESVTAGRPEKTGGKPSNIMFSLDSGTVDVNRLLNASHSELGKRILKVIIDKPFFSVKEIARSVGYVGYGGVKASKRAVRRELKHMGLSDMQKRYELAVQCRKR